MIKEGDQRAVVLRASTFDAVVEWRKLFPRVECVGVEPVEGKPAYKIEMTPNEGSVETRHYDKESGLLVKVLLTLNLPMGTIPVEAVLSDYKQVDGVLFAHKALRQSMGKSYSSSHSTLSTT